MKDKPQLSAEMRKKYKLTYCNMKNDGLFTKWQVNNGMCKNCIKELAKEQNV